MIERPILMSAPMVLACHRKVDPKTQTRRALKTLGADTFDWVHNANMGGPGGGRWWDGGWSGTQKINRFRCPYGVPGDVLWVRETLRRSEVGPWVYRADNEPVEMRHDDPRIAEMVAWAHHKEGDTCVSIHMPRWACRLRLRITDVRVERLNEISEADAKAEGLEVFNFTGWGDEPGVRGPAEPDVYRGYPEADWSEWPPEAYRALWDHINGPDSWAANPWVWAVTFERLP